MSSSGLQTRLSWVTGTDSDKPTGNYYYIMWKKCITKKSEKKRFSKATIFGNYTIPPISHHYNLTLPKLETARQMYIEIQFI